MALTLGSLKSACYGSEGSNKGLLITIATPSAEIGQHNDPLALHYPIISHHHGGLPMEAVDPETIDDTCNLNEVLSVGEGSYELLPEDIRLAGPSF